MRKYNKKELLKRNNMDERVKPIIAGASEDMEGAIMFLDDALAHIRAGKANPRIVDGVRVDYYGSMVPISNVANISTPDAKTIQRDMAVIPRFPQRGPRLVQEG